MVVIGWDEAAWVCEDRAMTAVRVARRAITAMSTSVSRDLRTTTGYNGQLTGRQRPTTSRPKVAAPGVGWLPWDRGGRIHSWPALRGSVVASNRALLRGTWLLLLLSLIHISEPTRPY